MNKIYFVERQDELESLDEPKRVCWCETKEKAFDVAREYKEQNPATTFYVVLYVPWETYKP